MGFVLEPLDLKSCTWLRLSDFNLYVLLIPAQAQYAGTPC